MLARRNTRCVLLRIFSNGSLESNEEIWANPTINDGQIRAFAGGKEAPGQTSAATEDRKASLVALVALFFAEVREHFFAEEASLLNAVISPEFEHHLCAAGGVIFLKFFDALFGRSRNGAHFVKGGV